LDICASLNSHDPLVNWLWPKVGADRGYTTAAQCSDIAKQEWLKSIPYSEVGRIKGPKAAEKIWYRVVQAYEFWQKDWHTKVFILVFISIRNGWSKSIRLIINVPLAQKTAAAEATPLPALEDGPVPAAAVSSSTARAASCGGAAAVSSTAAASSSGVAASSSSGGAASSSGAQEATTRGRAVALGKAAVQAERERCANTLHALVQLMLNDDLRRDMNMILVATKPLSQDH